MRLLAALEKHIPAAQTLLEEVHSSEPIGEHFEWDEEKAEKIQVFCVYGLSGSYYASARSWLDTDPERRLIFIEENPQAIVQLLDNEDAILLLNDLRVKIFFLDSPLQIGGVSKRVGWSAVFQE